MGTPQVECSTPTQRRGSTEGLTSSRNVPFTQHGIGGRLGTDRRGFGMIGRTGMGVIVNPRGTSGAGKTEFARRIMAAYGWPGEGRAEPIRRDGRERPIGYRLLHPGTGRPLAVLGHYEATSGGCDTIRALDGGPGEAFRLADAWASAGHDVLLEGLALSREHLRSAALAEAHPLHVLRLATPLDRCARNLIARTAALLDAEIEEACGWLRRSRASMEVLDFDDALRRARYLLGLARTAGPPPQPPAFCLAK
jgi:hypothetical protein